MSESETPIPDAEPGTAKPSFRGRGFRVFGLGLQDAIRYFFGGNASLAIILVLLICFFLGREGLLFFPAHLDGLKAYRNSGQEFVDLIGEQVDAHTEFYSNANIAYFAEVNESSRKEDEIIRVARTVLANTENACGRTWRLLERKLDDVEALEDQLKDLEPASTERPDLTAKRDARLAEIAGLRELLKREAAAALDGVDVWSLGGDGRDLTPEEQKRIRTAVLAQAAPDAKDEDPWLAEVKRRSREKKTAAAAGLSGFKDTLKGIQDAIRPMRTLHGELKKVALENRSRLTSASTAPARRAAMLEGAQKATDPAEKTRFQAEADKVVMEKPDLVAMNAPFYAAVKKHAELSAQLQGEMVRLYAALPGDAATKAAQEGLARSETLFARFVDRVESNRVAVTEWRHDQPVPAFTSFTSFVFGRQWITNSSWHDFYGLLPLLSGSLMIAAIALVVAVPVSVAAAIYVNQLAPTREQHFVKPAIEFIGAIPSVVLGFFGIVVFGEALRSLSQVEWLSWVPGFPMTERLTILNAGLLLAFMTTPTIFTLVEDALENVPMSFTESSLAMGASKLQTVFRVIVPSAVSGILAAILLGFGRIVGETMVVLLVAGNKIKIPDFSEGIGAVTQPAHTMTGIIAQELPEVDSGSLHWRALFIVGMVLFLIALSVNYSAQQIIKRFHKI